MKFLKFLFAFVIVISSAVFVSANTGPPDYGKDIVTYSVSVQSDFVEPCEMDALHQSYFLENPDFTLTFSYAVPEVTLIFYSKNDNCISNTNIPTYNNDLLATSYIYNRNLIKYILSKKVTLYFVYNCN